MSKSEKPEALKFAPIGDGIEYVVEGNVLHLHVNLDAAKGSPSGSGKMTLTGNTGGWQTVPNSNNLRLNVMAGYKVKAA